MMIVKRLSKAALTVEYLPPGFGWLQAGQVAAKVAGGKIEVPFSSLPAGAVNKAKGNPIRFRLEIAAQ